MFKYTAKKEIKKDLLKIRKAPYVRDKEWNFIHSLVPKMSYSMYVALRRWYLDTVFYSPTKLKEVPVNGILIPVYLFDEEEID